MESVSERTNIQGRERATNGNSRVPQFEAVRLSPAQAEFTLVSVRRLVDDSAFMRRLSQRDRLEFEQLEAAQAEVLEG